MLTLLLSLRDCFRARAFLQAEILALRHRLLVLQRSNRGHKLRLGWADRVLWVWLSRLCLAVVERLAIGVAPCQTGDGYRLASPGISPLLEMEESVLRRSPDRISGSSESHPAHESRHARWGAPRIHGELLKLGIQVSQATVAKYMVRHRKPPSQSWPTFLKNHAKDLVSADFFIVP